MELNQAMDVYKSAFCSLEYKRECPYFLYTEARKDKGKFMFVLSRLFLLQCSH